MLGQFTSRAPIRDLNLYEHGENNPWSNTEPSGMQAYGAADLNRLDRELHTMLATGNMFGRLSRVLRELPEIMPGRKSDALYRLVGKIERQLIDVSRQAPQSDERARVRSIKGPKDKQRRTGVFGGKPEV
ncbi:MAG TPA: hypothetical protein VFJ58_19950 [Armatimonadota bacterium]|nr:hypothetical protein [Armatimonadota bacterium]